MTFGLKQTMVGSFFERVAHQVLGGELTRNDDGDIVLPGLDAFVEIKSSALKSQYGFRLSVPQIERYERSLVFPFSRGYYALFGYRNDVRRVSGRKSSELAGFSTPEMIEPYLASAVQWCVMVDISIVTRWKLGRPRSYKSVMGHLGAETVDIHCREVEHLANSGFAQCLSELSLDPASYSKLKGKASVAGIEFNLVIALLNSDATRLRKHFRANGIDLRPNRHA